MEKGFVKNPYLPSVFGQNKTLKLCNNNVVINSRDRGQTALRTPDRSGRVVQATDLPPGGDRDPTAGRTAGGKGSAHRAF